MIVGIGPAATDHYYRYLISAIANAGHDLQLTMAHADTPPECQKRIDWVTCCNLLDRSTGVGLAQKFLRHSLQIARQA